MYTDHVMLYYLFLLLLLSLIVLYAICYESCRKRKQELAQGEIVGLWGANKERRRFRRLDTVLDIRYEVPENPRISQSGKTRDISQGGIGVIILEKFKPGTQLRIWVKFPNLKEELFMLGDVAWVREITKEKEEKRIFYAGIRFTAVDNVSQLKLGDFINIIEKQVIYEEKRKANQ